MVYDDGMGLMFCTQWSLSDGLHQGITWILIHMYKITGEWQHMINLYWQGQLSSNCTLTLGELSEDLNLSKEVFIHATVQKKKKAKKEYSPMFANMGSNSQFNHHH